MQLANTMNEIRAVDADTWRQRLSGRTNFARLESTAEHDFLTGCDRFWFVTTSFTAYVYGTILPRVQEILPRARLTSLDLIRGVLLHFACREATPGSYVVLAGRLRPSDIAFVDFAKNSGRFAFCEHPRTSAADRLVPAFGQLLFDSTPADLGALLPARAVCTLIFDLTADTPAVLGLLRDLAPLLAMDATLVAQGPSAALHPLFASLTGAGAAKLWAQCVIDGCVQAGHGHDHQAAARSTFAYFELLDTSALGAPAARKPRVRPSAVSLEPPRSADAGPHRYLTREQVGGAADTILQFAPERRVAVRPPLFIDLPENADQTWRGQFGATAQEWLGIAEITCPPLSCPLFDNLRIVGTEMLVSRNGLFPASQMPMSEQHFAGRASLFRADAQAVAGGFASARAAVIGQHVRAPSVVLSNGGLPMHYHFLFDVLPRLWFLRHESLASFSIALPETVAAYQIDVLTRYHGIDPERIEVFAVEGPSCLFDRACAAPSMVCDWWAMPEATIAPRTALRHAAPPADAAFRDAKRLYVSRRDVADSRGMVNESELVERLGALGFVEVFPSMFPYDQEMFLFNNAEIVVGPFGSGMANVMFCAPGAKIVFLQPDSTNWRIMSFVMDALDLQYGYIFGEAFRRQSRGHNTEWVIDADAVVARLRGLL